VLCVLRPVSADCKSVTFFADGAVIEQDAAAVKGTLEISLPADMLPGLSDAIISMVLACVSPNARTVGAASSQIGLSRMERVRQIVRRELMSPDLGPATLCRQAAMSRSQLYRLMEAEGGVAGYIQRQRLQYAYERAADPTCTASIAGIAESLCFPDASTFSRAFRRSFGVSPREVRAAAQAGAAIPPRRAAASDVGRFKDWLHAF